MIGAGLRAAAAMALLMAGSSRHDFLHGEPVHRSTEKPKDQQPVGRPTSNRKALALEKALRRKARWEK